MWSHCCHQLFSLVLGQCIQFNVQGIDFKMILMYPAWRAGTYIFIFSHRISLDARNAIFLYNCFGKNIPYEPMAMASRRCVRIIYNNSETFVFAGSSSIINSGLIFNPLQVYCGGIISLVLKAELLQLRF
jgi:hypothetical protein